MSGIILTDGKRMINIEMQNWLGIRYSSDLSEKYFDIDKLQSKVIENGKTVYYVDNIKECIDKAYAWEKNPNINISDGDDGMFGVIDKRLCITEIILPKMYRVIGKIRNEDFVKVMNARQLKKVQSKAREFDIPLIISSIEQIFA